MKIYVLAFRLEMHPLCFMKLYALLLFAFLPFSLVFALPVLAAPLVAMCLAFFISFGWRCSCGSWTWVWRCPWHTPCYGVMLWLFCWSCSYLFCGCLFCLLLCLLPNGCCRPCLFAAHCCPVFGASHGFGLTLFIASPSCTMPIHPLPERNAFNAAS